MELIRRIRKILFAFDIQIKYPGEFINNLRPLGAASKKKKGGKKNQKVSESAAVIARWKIYNIIAFKIKVKLKSLFFF